MADPLKLQLAQWVQTKLETEVPVLQDVEILSTLDPEDLEMETLSLPAAGIVVHSDDVVSAERGAMGVDLLEMRFSVFVAAEAMTGSEGLTDTSTGLYALWEEIVDNIANKQATGMGFPTRYTGTAQPFRTEAGRLVQEIAFYARVGVVRSTA